MHNNNNITYTFNTVFQEEQEPISHLNIYYHIDNEAIEVLSASGNQAIEELAVGLSFEFHATNYMTVGEDYNRVELEWGVCR